MSRKIKLIFNPYADRGHAWEVSQLLEPIIERRGGAEWAATQHPGHATELAKQAADQGFDAVVALGGDGTVHEIVNGLMEIPEDRRPLLAAVPIGSGNDFCANAGVPSDPEQAILRAYEGEVTTIDLGVIRDNTGHEEYWDNTISIGFGASVAIYSYQITRLRGYPMYLWAVIQTILRKHDAPHMTITTDEETIDQPVLLLSLNNGRREGGGFLTSPDAVLHDGVLNYAMIEDVSRAMMFRLLPEVMRGTHGRFRQVRLGQFRKMDLVSEKPIPIHTDGEIYADFASKVHQLSIHVLPQAMRLLL